MDERELLDLLYQMWTRTTSAKERYWDYEQEIDGENEHQIRSVSEDGDHEIVGWGLSDSDADFITAIHGCFPDLVRVVTKAFDEADRLLYERDSQECRIAELEMELADLKADLEGLVCG